jgi:cytochrome c peroxidase
MKLLATIIFIITLLSLNYNKKPISETIKGAVLANYEELSVSYSTFKTIPTKHNFQEVRSRYKKIEKYITYFYPSLAKEINGAPVLGLIKDGVIAEKTSPHGLQVIEEALQSNEKKVLKTEVHLLDQRFIQIKQKLQSVVFTERAILEANRFEVLRISTLGITGYENVQFSDGLEESIVSLKEINRELSLLKDTKSITKYTFSSIRMLIESDFENLDRMTLLKTGLDPLYQEILKLHNLLGIEKISDENILFPVNYDASSIFSPDFLNAGYYTKFKNKKSDTAQINLGQLLFFDPVLSSNNQRACASCHNPTLGFTDGRTKSLAFDKKGAVDRNSPTLLNSAFQSDYFHDMRAENLEEQIHHVVLSSKEFNTNFSEIILKIRSSDEYQRLFSKTFRAKGEQINITNLKIALASYVRSLSSFNSTFDLYMRSETTEIDPKVKNGFNLFTGKANCATCHFLPVFNGTVPPFYYDTDGEVLGVPSLDKEKLDSDIGRQGIVLNQYRYDFLKGMFKTPTVRNIELTAPYMHNGAYSTLEEVMEFYNDGGGVGLGFHVPNQTLSDEKLNLTKKEISELISFMKSLTDNPFESKPDRLPVFDTIIDTKRTIGGEY